MHSLFKNKETLNSFAGCLIFLTFVNDCIRWRLGGRGRYLFGQNNVVMKKTIGLLLLIMFLVPRSVMADGYDNMWKKVDEAAGKDQPRTALKHLASISEKAEKEKNYGQLLKAEWQTMMTWGEISRDSLLPQISRMELKAEEYGKTDPALAAVCYAALAKTCAENRWRVEGGDALADEYKVKAMADPALLAQKTTDAYVPFVVKGRDAAIFNDDLLSLVGFTVGAYKEMHGYYATTQNRAATMFTALLQARDEAENSGDLFVRKIEGSRYVATLDSLIRLYGDLPVCAEAAMERYSFMHNCDVSAKDLVAYANEAIARWGAWPRITTLRNDVKRLENPRFRVEAGRRVFMPGTPVTAHVTLTNIGKLTFTLTRLAVDGTEDGNTEDEKTYERLKAKAVGGAAQTLVRTYEGHAAYEEVEDSVVLGSLPAGVYLLEVTPDKKGIAPGRSLVHVSGLYFVQQELPGDKQRVAVLDAKTGQPVPGARLAYSFSGGDKRYTATCGADGEVVLPLEKRNLNYMRAYTAADNNMPWLYVYNNFSYYEADNNGDKLSLYTDRRIYRPGQTVHVAGILRNVKGDVRKAVEGRTVTLTLKDANYKTVAEKTATTDAYGTLSVDFALPKGGLTGAFSVRADNVRGGSVSFRVEEYKRPTFYVEFDEVKEKYANGDTLTVTGRAKTYAGVPVQGAKVKYTVDRNAALWWRFGFEGVYAQSTGGNMAEGEAVTDGNGEFKVKMPMVLPKWEDDDMGVSCDDFYKIARFYNFTAKADVTDQGGETRSGELNLPLGSKPTAFGCDMPAKTLRDSLKTIKFTLKNSAGNDIAGDVTYTVSGIDGTFTAKANEATTLTWTTAAMLRSGKHTLTAVCGADTVRQDFVVFSYDDAKPCVDTPDWFYLSAEQFPRGGEPVYMQFGSSRDSVHVLYTVISGEKVLKSGTLDMSDAVKTVKLAYKEEYGTGLRINLVWVKDGEAYSHSVGIKKPEPDKRLLLKWTTFRDKLTPGQQEEWTLSVTRPDGKPADAQLLATMYDASLDQIVPFSWTFDNSYYYALPFAQWNEPYIENIHIYNDAALKLPSIPMLDFGRMVTTLIHPLYGDVLVAKEELADGDKSYSATRAVSLSSIKIRGRSKKFTAPLMKKAAMVRKESLTVSNAAGDGAVVDTATVDGGESANAGAQVQLRENLNETAFFYPALYTDSTGNISLKFTLPESVTTWRLMGLAHDKEMNNGQIEAKAVASKKVMVQPNVPRFVRVGDKAQLSARIFNTCGEGVKGTAVMQMVDPETERVVVEMKKDFEVEAGSTGSVSFNYYPDANRPLLVCRIFAEGKDFSDGEQHYLPVLSDAELVTTTVPFTQHGPGVKSIDLKPLFPDGGRNEKLTVEYTNNPAWLMVQALPYINDAREDDAISLATAYYANSVSAYLLKQSPRVRSVFNQWRQEEGQESLMSSLEKNQELRNVVLDETPWVADADREADQKRMLANYFDESTLANNLSTTLEKLRRLQSQTDGSWCWWPGMSYGSPTLTAAVTETLVRLNAMTGEQAETKEMITKAMKFLGDRVVKEYEEAKEAKDKETEVYVYTYNALHYLYICALGDWQPTAKEREAADYLLGVLKEHYAGLNLYYKAIMAVVMAKRGETELAGEYVKSLDEYTVETEEMGRYYDSPRAGYSWFDYRIPTQVRAIEAMKLVDAKGYADTIEKMKRWLLMQKRVQGWDTPFNNVNAVYAFLDGNTAMLENGENATLAVDGKQLETPQATAGLGYVKTSESYDKGSVFTATKTSEGTSWGAVYAQSVQKTSSVAPSSAGISVTRELVTADGKPVSGLKVGDRVKVRVTIRADRDYDYVQVKDKRAACMEPVSQLSGYRSGSYCAPKDNATCYYFDRMSKGTHVIETEYYIDRAGKYETGTCTVQCAYAPEYSARAASLTIEVK